MTAMAPPVIFASKARTLEALAAMVRSSRVLPLHYFTAAAWAADPEGVLDRILAQPWAGKAVIVRSSSVFEDGSRTSAAGKFLSVAGVVGRDALKLAIIDVLGAYAAEDCATPDNEVLVQPMLAGVVSSGVAFTREPATGAPYYVINSAEGAETDSVTSGRQGDYTTFYLWRGSDVPADTGMTAVVGMLRELETLLGADAIDVEFALVSGADMPVLLQARPLVLPEASTMPLDEHGRLLASIARKIDQLNRPQPYLHGARTAFGVMPDWNPAEIIGIRPHPLALSIYRDLVTDSVWAYQRHNYGYRNLRSFPLMLEFHGLPYIDVRVSFNSFIPSDLPDDLADRLVDHYVGRLIALPELHDKVEFEIIHSCYSFDMEQRLARLSEAGFSNDERTQLAAALRRLTNRIINRDTGLWRTDWGRIEELERRRSVINASDLDPVSKVYWHLENTKRYGTLPFAGLARAGFIATQILRSMVKVGVLGAEQCEAFMAGLDTVGTALDRDLHSLDRASFLAKYGHLRPGTYDIVSQRYDECAELYFGDPTGPAAPKTTTRQPFTLTLPQMREIAALLATHELDHDVVGLMDFLEAGIRGREWSKFIFSRSLSDALSLLADIGAEHGFSREDMSFADVGVVRDLHGGCSDPREVLEESIARGRRRYERTQQIVLPPLITASEQVWSFHYPPSEPNFITRGSAIGRVCEARTEDDLTGAIVVLPSADPGYDWLFSRGIAGFITCYGGANSHMAVRASELNLPAVIGAGEQLFGRWSRAKLVHLDCASRRVVVLR